MYLPELGSGSESGSGSGDSFASGSEAAVVRQLASAQNIVSGLGQDTAVNPKEMNNTKKSTMPILKNVLKPKVSLSSAIVKKSSIPQRPVSPLKAMDVENVNDDYDDASASGSGSGSGDDVAPETIGKMIVFLMIRVGTRSKILTFGKAWFPYHLKCPGHVPFIASTMCLGRLRYMGTFLS